MTKVNNSYNFELDLIVSVIAVKVLAVMHNAEAIICIIWTFLKNDGILTKYLGVLMGSGVYSSVKSLSAKWNKVWVQQQMTESTVHKCSFLRT